MNEPRVVGIDPSLRATGIALDGRLSSFHPGKGITGAPRIRMIRAALLANTVNARPDLAVIEGPAYSRQLGAGHHEAAGLWWAIIDMLWTHDVPYAVVPPTVLKKYATGRGNAAKPDMRMALYQRTGVDVGDDNEVDAAWLRAMGLDRLGAAEFAVPQAHRDALGKVDWPEVTA